jgi:hypothetical protein
MKRQIKVGWGLVIILVVFAIRSVMATFSQEKTKLVQTKSWEEVKKYRFEKTPGLKCADRLLFDHFELGTSVNKLYFRLQPGNNQQRLVKLALSLQSDKNEQHSAGMTWVNPDQTGLSYLEFPPFDERPKSIKLTVHMCKCMGIISLRFKSIYSSSAHFWIMRMKRSGRTSTKNWGK